MAKTHIGSPWLEQLQKDRVSSPLAENHSTDIAVVGAGIAGAATTYFLLKHTHKRVALIEGERVAHGATGHNAGQMVSYFERAFSDIVSEFGLPMAAEGQKAITSAWDLLATIQSDLQLQTPSATFIGYAGCVDLSELLIHLQNNKLQLEAGLPVEKILVAKTFARRGDIPRTFRKLYTIVPDQTLLDLLETKDHHYVAALSGKKGCMNSAKFTEEVITILQQRYPERLILAEHTPVDVVRLHKQHAELVSGDYIVRAKRVVLCTNGFERLRIENKAGANIDLKFHHNVRGSVGYMAAFMEEPQMQPTAVSYLPSHLKNISGGYDAEPYYYLTRRPQGDDARQSLVCIGGPEALMDDTNNYSREHPYPNEAKTIIRDFVQRTYRHAGRRLTYTHLWHGLMGYTPNGIRCVGAEPCNPVLLYNLGCNGVGILPSLYGGFRIAQIIKGNKMQPSIFDPADLRCMLPEQKTKEDTVASDKGFVRHMVWGFAIFWGLATIAILLTYWIKS